MIRIGIEHKNPCTARNLVRWHILGLSERLRGEVIREADENIRFFTEQIDQTEDPLLREKLYSMLAGEIEKMTLAKAQKYYGFIVLDPPVASDMNKTIRPKRRKALMTGIWLSFFFGIFLTAGVEFLRRIKKIDSPKLQEIFREISYRGKRNKS